MQSPNGFEIPDKTFESDGCSGGFSAMWKAVTGKAPAFEGCCFEHDIEYHFGSGSLPEVPEGLTRWEELKFRARRLVRRLSDRYHERREADRNLFRCVRAHPGGGLLWASLMYLGVRIGGGAYWRRTYSWGFGWER